MYGPKKYIDRKYADTIMQLASHYRNTHPAGSSLSFGMDRTLETMDSYVAFINNMGYTMYEISIETMIKYIDEIKHTPGRFSPVELEELQKYLETL